MIILMLLCHTTFAQEIETNITGRVLSDEGDSLSLVTVYLSDATERIINYTQTDENGSFILSAPMGKYNIGFSRIGYNNIRQQIIIDKQPIQLNDIILSTNIESIQEVIVKGEAMNIRNTHDGFIINVDKLVSTSNNSLDLIKRLPMISVKGNEINIVGKDKVLVKIGNVLQRVENDELAILLKGLDAKNIDKVEVLMQPPLRYDSDGNTAMIILHPTSDFSKKYFSATIGSENMYGGKSNYRYGGYIPIFYNNNKVYVSYSPSLNFNASSSEEESIYNYNENTFYSISSPSSGTSDYWGGTINAQYQYSEVNNVGLYLSYGVRKRANHYTNYEQISTADNVLSDNIMTSRLPNISTALYWEKQFGKRDNRMWIEISYTRLEEKSNTEYSGEYELSGDVFSRYFDNDYVSTNGINLSNDFAFYLNDNKKYLLETGLKAMMSATNNNREHEQWKMDCPQETFQQASGITHNEILIKPYMSATFRFSDKIWMRTGLNLSASFSTLNEPGEKSNHNMYMDFLPQLHTSYSPKVNHKLSLTVNSGIKYPSFQDLNPFEWVVNEKNIYLGNPKLRPSTLYNGKIGYTYKGAMSLSLKVSYYKDMISNVSKLRSDGIIQSQTANAQNGLLSSLNANYYYDKSNWLIISVNAHFGYSYYKSLLEGLLPKSYGFNWGVNSYIDIVFNKSRTFSGYISGSYTGKQTTTVSTVNPQFDISCGIYLFLLDKKLSLSISGLSIISSRYTGISYRDGYTINFNNRYNFPTLYISISYRFSNLKQKSPAKRLSNFDVEQRFIN